MLATVIDVGVILQVIGGSFAAGIGITAIFGLVIYSSTRFEDLRREGNAAGASCFAVFAVLGVAAFFATVVYGIIVMANK